MRLDAVLKKVGASIVRSSNTDKKVVLFIRVNKEGRFAGLWKKALEEILLYAHTTKNKRWAIDISKAFFVDSGAVKYLWRVIITGDDVQDGAEQFGQAILRTVSQTVEVTSYPLVGRVHYTPDPAKGKTKGVYTGEGVASKVIAATNAGVSK